MEDNNRKWRCQVNTKEEAGVVFLDFTSTFVFESKNLMRSALQKCPFHLPITRILLSVLLSLAAVTAGVFMWRKVKDGVRRSAAHIQLQSIPTSEGC